MTTFSFKVDSSESKKIKAILKALGVTELKIKDEETPSKKFAEKVERARKEHSEGKTVAVNTKNIWEGIE
ncbi:hypothetical protein ASG31_01155 [Chryseobacterium sp. Leaf404]|uniref:DUF2683 family protein n=1 Tax=unclassified Chryseobacterium TaxID=2593645 RepID=UPI0006F55713|nr:MULTISPECIES: DUF2683 family protein [unclassified Chryseobacterium]KQT21983.1 hypothetical protein ASG31_01155 [Chryseobacterium sp. Leaf404]